MFIATMKTEHFEFAAGGQTKSQAQRTLVDGFRKHLKEYNSDAQHWCETTNEISGTTTYTVGAFAAALEDWYGFHVFELSPGVCMRDGSVL